MGIDKYKFIRCKADRPHYTKGELVECCDSLLLGVSLELPTDIKIQCRVCKQWWIIESDGEETITITEADE